MLQDGGGRRRLHPLKFLIGDAHDREELSCASRTLECWELWVESERHGGEVGAGLTGEGRTSVEPVAGSERTAGLEDVVAKLLEQAPRPRRRFGLVAAGQADGQLEAPAADRRVAGVLVEQLREPERDKSQYSSPR